MQDLYDWFGTLYTEDVNRPPYSSFIDFQHSYTTSEGFPFLPTQASARNIPHDPEVIRGTSFLAFAPGLNANVPIPFHPGLCDTRFYTQLGYLLQTASAFTHYPGLGNLQQHHVNEAFVTNQQLSATIRRALGAGKPVLVRGATTSFDGISSSVDDTTFSALTIQPDTVVEVQDLAHWPSTLAMPVQTFWDSRDDPAVNYNFLDLNGFGRYQQPTWIRLLYSDRTAIQKVVNLQTSLPTDLVRLPSWMLLGHGFSHTFAHQDATGFLTHVTIKSGYKLWFLLEWTEHPTPQDWYNRFHRMEEQDFFALEYRNRPPWIVGHGHYAQFDHELYAQHSGHWDSEERVARWTVVELAPQTTLVMPPGQPHWVYSPQTTLCIGGHGLLWSAIPLTEVGCRMCNLGSTLTNDVHPSAMQIHQAMADSLPTSPAVALQRGRAESELVSIARLVLAPQLYTQKPSTRDVRHGTQGAPDLENRARMKMTQYAEYFGVTIPSSTSTTRAALPQDFVWAPTATLYLSP